METRVDSMPRNQFYLPHGMTKTSASGTLPWLGLKMAPHSRLHHHVMGFLCFRNLHGLLPTSFHDDSLTNFERLNFERPNFERLDFERPNFEQPNFEDSTSKRTQLQTAELRKGPNLECDSTSNFELQNLKSFKA
jgi:uncharacterized protein YjbI with pentapeptide repeats